MNAQEARKSKEPTDHLNGEAWISAGAYKKADSEIASGRESKDIEACRYTP